MKKPRLKGKRIGWCGCGSFGRLTDHHIIPIAIRPTSKQVIAICKNCHNELHKAFPHGVLAELSEKGLKLWVEGQKGMTRIEKDKIRYA